MNKEIEICVKCYDSLEELNKKLKLNKFVVKEDFILKDIYMSNELKEINVGLNITAALISSAIRGLNSLLDLGRSLGTAIRRIRYGRMCSL